MTRLKLATWGRRLGAYLLDVLVLIAPIVVIVVFLGHWHRVTVYNSNGTSVQSYRITNAADVRLAAAGGAVWFVYLTACNAWRRGRTVGMGALGLAVRQASDGAPPSLGRSAGRAAFWFLGVIPVAGGLVFLLDCLWPLWDSRRQALHDKAAGTVVVDERSRPY